jgi:ABC-type uncharacterized transport system substrate-binding protein
MVLMRAVVWAVLALLFSATVHARLLLITSQDAPLYQEFQQGLSGGLAKGQELDIRQAGEVAALEFSPYSAIVVAGVEAAKALAQRGDVARPVFYTMLPLSSYQWLDDRNMLAAQHKVLYIDQPPQRYLQFARAAMPDMDAIGYLHGDTSKDSADGLRQAAEVVKLGFVAANVASGGKLSNLLKELFSRSDAVLLLPDPALYNRRAVQEVLLTSFRYKRPLIAYSESFVKAGAMLALFSTPAQIGRQTAELLGCMGQPCYSGVPQRSYPKYFSVMVNEAVARQLGVESKSAEELQRHLESAEAARLK